MVIGTAQQINIKLVHPFEKFRQNLLVKFYSTEGFQFSDTQARTEKNFSLGFVVVQNIESLKLCHVLLKQSLENVFGYVHTVPDSETERREKCTGYSFCSH